MNSELLEYLLIVEMKTLALLQDIRNIKSRFEVPQTPRLANNQAPTFFETLASEDVRHNNQPRNG